ncbi:unnamed protein product, partial [marine sediment metagenome]
MVLIIFNPRELPELPRDKEDYNRKIIIQGSFRHTHQEPVKGRLMFELENDTEVGKVSLYLDEYELEALKGE